jgi:hypothetical protein
MAIQSYDFALEWFTIHNTRARHLDTDYASLSLSVGGQAASTKTQKMGDLNNGTYSTGLTFENVAIGDEQIVVFSYTIMNNGHSNPDVVEKNLADAATTLANKAAQAAAQAAVKPIAEDIAEEAGTLLGGTLGTIVVPVIGSAIGALAGWIVGKTGAALFANCDGVVATGVHFFTGADLRSRTNGDRAVSATEKNPGTDSPDGCGSNSDYDVTWTVRSVMASRISPGTRYAIQVPSGQYLTAVNGGGIAGEPGNRLPFHTDATQIGPWEKFKFINLGGASYAIQTVNGNYVTVVNAGGLEGPANGLPLHTDATQLGPWETFTLFSAETDYYAIKTATGNYVTAVNGGGIVGEPGNQLPLHTDATQIGPWEQFTLVNIDAEQKRRRGNL